MAKRDYYDVLGVNKSASGDQIKAAYRSLLLNITQTRIKEIKLPKKNLKKHPRLIIFYQILRENKITIILDMLLLRIMVVEEEDLVTLIFLVISQTYSKTFLVTLAEVVEEVEKQILKVLT